MLKQIIESVEKMLRYTLNLKFTEWPDYDFLISKLRRIVDLFNSKTIEKSYEYEWVIHKNFELFIEKADKVSADTNKQEKCCDNLNI